MKIIIEDGAVSDLFFNYEHPNFERLFTSRKNGPTREEQHAAILKDATEFANDYGGDAAWYANDFMSRL